MKNAVKETSNSIDFWKVARSSQFAVYKQYDGRERAPNFDEFHNLAIVALIDGHRIPETLITDDTLASAREKQSELSSYVSLDGPSYLTEHLSPNCSLPALVAQLLSTSEIKSMKYNPIRSDEDAPE